VRQAGGEAVQPSAKLKILNKFTSAEPAKKDMLFKAFGEMAPLISSLQDIRFLLSVHTSNGGVGFLFTGPRSTTNPRAGRLS